MKGAARLRVGVAGATELAAEPPFAIRRSGDRYIVVGSAAAPVGGDELALSIDVDDDARAVVTTAAATMVWPAPEGDSASSLTTDLGVGARAHLTWWPEPTVSVARSRHRARTTVRLGADATATIVEELALGRHEEVPGFVDGSIRVERAGDVLVHHAEQYGLGSAGWGSVVGTGSARHVVSAVIVGPGVLGESCATVGREGDVSWAWLPVADGAAMVLALGPDRPSVMRRVHGLLDPAAVLGAPLPA